MNILPYRVLATKQAIGRLCQGDYVYAPSVFMRAVDFAAETLDVFGGPYGNLAALTAIEALAAAEPTAPQIVFNDDFHWFEPAPERFAAFENGVAPNRTLRGNVENKIARSDEIGADCGCAYPETVDDGTVERSNEILERLRATMPAAARASP